MKKNNRKQKTYGIRIRLAAVTYSYHRWKWLIGGGLGCLAVVRSLAQWTLDFPAVATGLDFPFDRPYLDLYEAKQPCYADFDTMRRCPPCGRGGAARRRRHHRGSALDLRGAV
jgi:hypothetical protein